MGTPANGGGKSANNGENQPGNEAENKMNTNTKKGDLFQNENMKKKKKWWANN